MEQKRTSIKRLLLAGLALAVLASAIPGQQKVPDTSKSESVERQMVVIIGAVRTPSRFEFRENVRLNQLIVCAGGLTDAAGKSLQIMNSGAPHCSNCSGVFFAEPPGLYNLAAVMSGQEASNPVVQVGDIIVVWESEPVFVTGYVVHRKQFPQEGRLR